uniref:Anthocyanin acyltransferase n=1 Tax=Solanum tuberosum TaxID=4113 RepID=M1ATR4_SOLTU
MLHYHLQTTFQQVDRTWLELQTVSFVVVYELLRRVVGGSFLVELEGRSKEGAQQN